MLVPAQAGAFLKATLTFACVHACDKLAHVQDGYHPNEVFMMEALNVILNMYFQFIGCGGRARRHKHAYGLGFGHE